MSTTKLTRVSDSDAFATGPVALYICAGSEAALKKAVELCKRHLEGVRADYNRWLQASLALTSLAPLSRFHKSRMMASCRARNDP